MTDKPDLEAITALCASFQNGDVGSRSAGDALAALNVFIDQVPNLIARIKELEDECEELDRKAESYLQAYIYGG